MVGERRTLGTSLPGALFSSGSLYPLGPSAFTGDTEKMDDVPAAWKSHTFSFRYTLDAGECNSHLLQSVSGMIHCEKKRGSSSYRAAAGCGPACGAGPPHSCRGTRCATSSVH